MEQNKSIICIENVCKNYGKQRVLDKVSFTVQEGDIFGLLGGNGAGKSTLIAILSGLVLPSAGTITIDGKDRVHDLLAIQKSINIAPQDSAVAQNLTVQENLEFFAKLYFKDRQKAKQRVDAMVQQFVLDAVLKKQAKKLSGGMMRRLSLAIAFLTEPKILFLDEPTLGLDVLSRAYLWEMIESLKGKTTVLLTTHYLEEIQALCNQIAILDAGKVQFTGTIADAIQKANVEKFEDAFLYFIKNKEGVC